MATFTFFLFEGDEHLFIFLFGRGWPPIYFLIWEGMATKLFVYVKIIWERMSIYLFIFFSFIYLFIYLSIYLFIYLLTYLFIYLFIYLSIYLFTWEGMAIYPFCILERMATNLPIHWGVATWWGLLFISLYQHIWGRLGIYLPI